MRSAGQTGDRLTALDSFRACAALYVLAFHYFCRWTSGPEAEQLLQPTPLLSSSALIRNGHLGVEWFFMISGFVIALTLTRTSSFFEFATKRFARLFPAMLACSLLTYAVVRALDVAPLSAVAPIDFVPSLTFTSPEIINKLFGVDSDWISGVYWTLFVEVKFYFFAAMAYFVAPRRFLVSFFAVAAFGCALYWSALLTGVVAASNALTLFFFPEYAFLFVAGMAFYQLQSSTAESRPAVVTILALSLAYNAFMYSPWNPTQDATITTMALVVGFHVLFALFLMDSPLLAPFNSRLLAKVGAASYSLYLLHESIGVSLIHRLNEHVAVSPAWPFVTAAAMVAVSIFLYEYVESPARRILRKGFAARREEVPCELPAGAGDSGLYGS